MVFRVKKLTEQPPLFEAAVEVWGEEYRGASRPQKKAAEHEAALVALEALLSRASGLCEPPAGRAAPAPEAGAGAGGGAAQPAGAGDGAERGVDYKGQLLHWFQVRGVNGAEAARFEVERCDPEEKAFRCRVVAECLGGLAFEGQPQGRDAHGSSARARRAAEQDAARAALRALEEREERGGGAAAAAGRAPGPEPPGAARARALRLSPDPAVLPAPEAVRVEAGDFLGAAARALACRDVFPHPLQWAGDRPRGLALFEAVPGSPAAPGPNARASFLAGAPVAGDVLLIDASAHSSGAVLKDVTMARYEALKQERSGALRGPAAILNASRGMQMAGHPELPLAYDADRWIGVNPKTLLNETLKANGIRETAQYEVMAEEGGGLFRGKASIKVADNEFIHAQGPPLRRSKIDAQQDAALALLHTLLGSGTIGSKEACMTASAVARPFASEAWHALANSPDLCEHLGGALSSENCHDGSLLQLDYHISIAELGERGSSVSGAGQGTTVMEECSRAQAVVGARVLNPVLEQAAMRAPLGTALSFQSETGYESVPCMVRLDLMVHERTRPATGACLEGAPPPDGSMLLQFDPPLRRQRISFIVDTLIGLGVKSVLDLGCGDGQLLEALLTAGVGHVIGIDHSEKRARAAQKKVETVLREDQVGEVIVADMLKPEAPHVHVDAIVLSEVLEHVPTSKLGHAAEALLGRRPRVAIVTTPNAEFGSAAAASGASMRHPDHEREWTRDEFRKWAADVAAEHHYDLMAPQGVGEIPDNTGQGPCTQIAVFVRALGAAAEHSGNGKILADPMNATLEAAGADASGHTPEIAGLEIARDEDKGSTATFDLAAVFHSALRSEELVAGSGLWKHVHHEGRGDAPPRHSRITVHYASYRLDGQLIDTSRDGRRVTPSVFQLGGTSVIEAWQRAAASMRRGEISWIDSPPAFAFGEAGAPPRIPAGENIWIMLELVDFRLPGTLRSFKDLGLAMDEAERHMGMGRDDLASQAFGRARQAFRRALDAVPEKLLLDSPREEVARFAALERSSLLNQALCSQRLGEASEDSERAKHWEDVVRVCSLLLRRHLPDGVPGGRAAGEAAAAEVPRNTSMVPAALQGASASAGCQQWAAKALFRRGLAREHLGYVSDAVEDLALALQLEPGDAAVGRRLRALRQRQAQLELRPRRMFASILEREREEREAQEAASGLEEKRLRREARLRRQAAQGGPPARAAV